MKKIISFTILLIVSICTGCGNPEQYKNDSVQADANTRSIYRARYYDEYPFICNQCGCRRVYSHGSPKCDACGHDIKEHKL